MHQDTLTRDTADNLDQQYAEVLRNEREAAAAAEAAAGGAEHGNDVDSNESDSSEDSNVEEDDESLNVLVSLSGALAVQLMNRTWQPYQFFLWSTKTILTACDRAHLPRLLKP